MKILLTVQGMLPQSQAVLHFSLVEDALHDAEAGVAAERGDPEDESGGAGLYCETGERVISLQKHLKWAKQEFREIMDQYQVMAEHLQEVQTLLMHSKEEVRQEAAAWRWVEKDREAV